MSAALEQLGDSEPLLRETSGRTGKARRAPRLQSDSKKTLEDFARRCTTSGQANESETETLRMFFDCRQNIARLLNNFAPVCDRLAELAHKSASGQPLQGTLSINCELRGHPGRIPLLLW